MSEFSNPNNINQTRGTSTSSNAGAAPAATHQQPLADRMAQGAHHTIDRLVETATPHIERMEDAFSEATGHIKDQAQHAREKSDEWANDLRATVRRNPLSAVAAAAVLGALIARITR